MVKLPQDYEILFSGNLKENQIVLHDIRQKKEFSPKVQELIEGEWEAVLLNKEIFIFNGAVSSLDHFEYRDSVLHIYYCESDYKAYYGTNIKNSNTLSEQKDLAYALAVCTIVESSDGKIIVGKRGGHLAEGRAFWHVPGGTLEYYPDRVNHPFEVMKRELVEELNLSDISSMICLGLGENRTLAKPEFLLYTKTDLTSKQIEENMSEAVDFNEHSEIKFIPKENILDFVEEVNFTEIGRAVVELYLKSK